MKLHPSPLLLVVPVAFALTACNSSFFDNLNKPLAGGGNALDPPGYQDRQDPIELVEATGPTYQPGQWVETSVASAAFYNKLPKSGDQPVRNLPIGTPLKVVSTQGTYAKVELESGAIGYVPSIMVSQKASPNEVPIVPTGPTDVLPPGYSGGLAPEPEVAPLSVQDAGGVSVPVDRIDPTADDIE